MEFLEIPLFDDDFFKMLFRFVINILATTIIIRQLYYKKTSKKDYFFTYYMISIIVFFLCFTLKKYELDIGMALGLFAIFGIIRYRTDAIEIKDMTFLFVVIGISVINALANKKMSYVEIISANLIIIGAIAIMESLRFFGNEVKKNIIYEKMENIRPENHPQLLADLRNRTGLNITRFVINDINLLRDTAAITIYYEEIKSTKKEK